MEALFAKAKAADDKVAQLLDAGKPANMDVTNWRKSEEGKKLYKLAELARALAADSRVQVKDLLVADAHIVAQLREIYETVYKVTEAEYQQIYKGKPSLQRMEQASYEGLLIAAGEVVETVTSKPHKHIIVKDGQEDEETKKAHMLRQTISIKLDGATTNVELVHVGFTEETLKQVGWRLEPFQRAERQQRVKLVTEMRLINIVPATGESYWRWIGNRYRITSRIGASNLTELPAAEGEQQRAPEVTSNSFEEME